MPTFLILSPKLALPCGRFCCRRAGPRGRRRAGRGTQGLALYLKIHVAANGCRCRRQTGARGRHCRQHVGPWGRLRLRRRPSLHGFTGMPPYERKSARTTTRLRYGLRGRPCQAVPTFDSTGESITRGEVQGGNIHWDRLLPKRILPAILQTLGTSATRMSLQSPRYH